MVRRTFSFTALDDSDGKHAERSTKRRPFSNWVKKIANFKGGDQQSHSKKNAVLPLANKSKKGHAQSDSLQNKHNNPYPQSGHVQQSAASSANGQLSFATPTSQAQQDNGSLTSLPLSAPQDREGKSNSNRSNAPTVATNPETIHSDAGHSKAPTTATGGGALSSVDGAGGGSTFSSPNQSEQSLTTTLTTIQSQSAGNTLQQGAASGHANANTPNNPPSVMFSHQYPVSSSHTTGTTISAIPRHISEALPQNYTSATANNLLSDNASILTLASSSKRRRRSMDTDASVRAIPPSSVWGGSRESLPLSVLSGNIDRDPANGPMYAQGRPSIGGLTSGERASIYSSQGVSAPALASERNSYYAASSKPKRDEFTDAKSVRSITNNDNRSTYDTKSINDTKSMEISSARNYEGSAKSGAMGHGRNDSIPGSIGSPLVSPGLKHGGNNGGLSRRSSGWTELEKDEAENQQVKRDEGGAATDEEH